MIKNKEYYQAIDYDIIVSTVSEDDGGGYMAYYKNIDGVMGDGKTESEAVADVKNAFDCYLDVALKNKDAIPEPENLNKAKKINISMAASKIKSLDIYAKRLNTTRSGLLTMLSDKLLNGDIELHPKP
ncbi:type II toxin-antitoxin system HicB family antitoxin [Bathymodiolus septemdierum thioautotrophic gill symbiont]|uniref:HicB family protein n=1 Tax=endosymbiont of Bathymodiolus septemdierum str. Myojin knoll TaxID=1303921 RepID=A0A0P0UQ63_9GAMM|nr:HicB family protein [Bathymodiolus septemdierum thioautotrophic gill symbiont]BAS67140.1 conserved hypothetical protein [endosymbiont of Bathymodiolus septemdierum str. Myojin knoll]